MKERRNECRSTQQQSGSFCVDEELGRVGLPVEKVGNSLPFQVCLFFFFTVPELCILSLLDIWAAPNEAYIIAT